MFLSRLLSRTPTVRETPPGPVVEEDREAQNTHLWRAGERVIRPGGRAMG